MYHLKHLGTFCSCVASVDLDYPSSLHETHNDLPLAPESYSVPVADMPPYQCSLIEKLRPSGVEGKKLVPNLQPKTRYVLHYRNLQQYVRLGLRVTKFQRALKFRQSPWMTPYITKNTELRKQATTDFHKDLYKLMNNAVRSLKSTVFLNQLRDSKS